MAEKQEHQWQDSSSQFVDAYIDWVRETAKWVLDPKDEVRTVPVLVSLQTGKTKRDFLRECEHLLRRSPDKPDDDGIPADLERSQFTLRVRCEALDRLKGVANSQLVHRIAIAHNLPCHATREDRRGDEKGSVSEQEQAVGKYEPHDGSPVVMGIIDEGIAFANQRFRNGPDKSRVEYAWIQDGRARGDVAYGLELTKADIDESLGKCVSEGQVDEDLFYSITGVVDFGQAAHKATAKRAGHGTHVMDLACGFEEGSLLTGEGDAGREGKVQRPIVCVKLPTVTVAETSGIGLEYYVLDGVDYILRRARDIARRLKCNELPVVINFSSGILAGPRDGTQPIELAIDDRIRRRRTKMAPTDVVLPSGNSRLSRLHARISLAPSGQDEDSKELQFRVLPDDRTCSYLEIWLPARDKAWSEDGWMDLTLKPPGGETSEALVAGTGKHAIEWAPHGDVLCKIYYEFVGHPTMRGRYVIALLPTALPDSAQQLAPFGTWTIAVRNRMNAPIRDVQASIQWDDRPLGYPQNGRQSYFIDDRYRRFEESGREVDVDNESFIKREGSINAIATGSETIVVAGCVRNEGRVVRYSSGGPTARAGGAAIADARRGPDTSAWSDRSYVHQGILAAGTRSGSVMAMNGTSVAAPQIAREIAIRREQGDRRSGREIVETLGEPVITAPWEATGLKGIQSVSAERIGSGRVVSPEGEVDRSDRLD